jgi:hypothetical protein
LFHSFGRVYEIDVRAREITLVPGDAGETLVGILLSGTELNPVHSPATKLPAATITH